MRLLDAPYAVRVFGMSCWSALQPEESASPRGYLPYWRFLEEAEYNPAERTLKFGLYNWETPGVEGTNG